MKAQLEEEIEKLRERNREMDLWCEQKLGAVDMEDGSLGWGGVLMGWMKGWSWRMRRPRRLDLSVIAQ